MRRVHVGQLIFNAPQGYTSTKKEKKKKKQIDGRKVEKNKKYGKKKSKKRY
jgi:hypothetical protein